MKNKGITLIALVLTIIILLILAGVTLRIVFNDGIFNNTSKAVALQSYNIANEKITIVNNDINLIILEKYRNDRTYNANSEEEMTQFKNMAISLLNDNEKWTVTNTLYQLNIELNDKRINKDVIKENTPLYDGKVYYIIKINNTGAELISNVSEEQIQGPVYNKNDLGGKLISAGVIKSKLNSTGKNYSNITAFLKSENEPDTSDTVVEIQAVDSSVVIYAWIDNENKCYWYSEDNSPIVNADMQGMFQDCKNLTTISGISTWDSSNVTNIKNICRNCEKLTSLVPFKGWNVSSMSGTMAEYMFQNCKAITNLDGLQNFRFNNITDLHCTFENCQNLQDISQLKSWGCSSINKLDSTFRGCTKLSSLNGLEDWNVSNVEEMFRTFYQCTTLSDISALASWGDKLTNLTSMKECFYQNYAITSLIPLKDWNTPKLKDMSSTFAQLKKITTLKDLENWDVSKVTNFANTFDTCESIESLDGLQNWNVSNATTFTIMFFNTRKLKDATAIKDWNVNQNMNFTKMLGGNHNFTFNKEKFTNLPNGDWNSEGTYVLN